MKTEILSVTIRQAMRIDGTEVPAGTKLTVVPDETGEPVDLKAGTMWKTRARVLQVSFSDPRGIKLSFD